MRELHEGGVFDDLLGDLLIRQINISGFEPNHSWSLVHNLGVL